MPADVIDTHLANIRNKNYPKNRYSEMQSKTDFQKIKIYRPVSLLNIFLRVYEKFIHNNLTKYADTFLSEFTSA